MFSEGVEYLDDVDVSGFYKELALEKQFGTYEYVKALVLKQMWGVNETVLASEHAKVPDKYSDKTY